MTTFFVSSEPPRGARRQGSGAADAAAAAGVSRATLYRWAAGAEPCSRRPHTPRRPAWSAALVTAVRETRADYNDAWRYEFYASWDLPDDDLDHINRWIHAFADAFQHLPTTPSPWRTYPRRVSCQTPGRRHPPVSYVLNQDIRLTQ